MSETFIAISGGFDPLHGGHIDYIEAAATYGNVIVILNTDEWLTRKKGYSFMTFEERKRILLAIEDVYDVVMADDRDETVCDSLIKLAGVVTYFGKGGDRNVRNTPEIAICKEIGIKSVFGLGGNKTQSSSNLVKNVRTH